MTRGTGSGEDAARSSHAARSSSRSRLSLRPSAGSQLRPVPEHHDESRDWSHDVSPAEARRAPNYWTELPPDPLDLLAELELFPDGRGEVEPAATPSWTLAEEAAPASRERKPTALELWPPAVDAEAAAQAEAEAAAERWRRAASVLEVAPGLHQLEPSPDEPRGTVRPHYTSIGVGRVSTLDSLVASLQHRYRGVLDSLERNALTRPPPDELRLSLPALDNAAEEPPETPGRERLEFARTCLEQLSKYAALPSAKRAAGTGMGSF